MMSLAMMLMEMQVEVMNVPVSTKATASIRFIIAAGTLIINIT